MDDPVSNKKKNFLIRMGAKREFGSVLFQGVLEDLLIYCLSFLSLCLCPKLVKDLLAEGEQVSSSVLGLELGL